MTNLFDIGVSGLRAQQSALNVVGQNITNASTPGYSRQRVEFAAQQGNQFAGDFGGSGVRLDRVARVASEFATRQIRTDTSLLGENAALADQIRQIEGLLFSETAGIDVALSDFFEALQNVNSSPASLPDRQVVLNQATALGDRFSTVHARLDEQFANVDSLLDAAASEVNGLAVEIASLNERITQLRTSSTTGGLNTALDQRDEILRRLSEFVSVTTSEQSNGQLSVFIGRGQALVLGANAGQLSVEGNGEILLATDSQTRPDRVSDALVGGEIGGLLRFREQTLEVTLNGLGRLAASVAFAVNETHREGIDLNGQFGGDFFSSFNNPADTQFRFRADSRNDSELAGQILVEITDPFQLSDSDYQLVFSETQPGTFFVQRETDNEVVFQGILSQLDSQRFEFEGVAVTITGGQFPPGDRFELSPARDLAAQLRLNLADPRELALAAPVRLTAGVGNTGGAELNLNELIDAEHPVFDQAQELVPPLRVIFTSENRFDVLDFSDPSNPRQLDPPLRGLPFTPGLQASLLPTELGTTRIGSDGTSIANLPASAISTTDTTPLGNGYPGGTVTISEQDPVTQQVSQRTPIGIPPNASAAQIATLLSQEAGVTANAFTELRLTNLVTNNTGEPLTVTINGVDIVDVQNLNDLADQIADTPALAAVGIEARSDGETLTLTHLDGDDLTVHVSGDPADALVADNGKGDTVALRGTGPGSFEGVAIGGSVSAILAPNVSLNANITGVFSVTPTPVRADFGIEVVIDGAPDAGDTFDISFNLGGVNDNRNGNRLAELASIRRLGDPPESFSERYAGLVQELGVATNQAQIQRDAAVTLLDQSTNLREEISGVNLDEEAANLIQFEQAYNASAQIISVARDVFDILFSVVR